MLKALDRAVIVIAGLGAFSFISHYYMVVTLPNCEEARGLINLVGEIYPLTPIGCKDELAPSRFDIGDAS